jgi:SPP1 gp7 family putative phage head morphogenesis protein
MPKKNRKYWQERYEQLEKSAHSYSLSTYAQIEPAFKQAQMEIQKDIDAWYGRIAVNNNVTLQEAKKLLTADELAEFKWDVNEYIKYAKKNAINHQWVKQLENASAKYHINKLEALKIRTQQAVEKAFGNELDAVDSMARKVYSNSYYHSIFEMQKGFNMGREIATIDEKALEKIITKPWAADGKNFSDRIWQSKAQLVNELHNQLTRTVLLGNKPDSAIKAISDKFNVSKSQAANLVMTEQTYFHSLATYDSFKSMGIEQYEFLATLDKRTTQMCRSMDGKHFPMSEYMPGATAPPLHPRCRSVTVPYFDDEYSNLFNNGSMRAARNEDDKTYYVPADMNYKEWEKKFVVQKSKTRKNNKITLNKVVSTANQIVNSSVQQKEHKESKLTYDEEYAINQNVSSAAYNLNEKLRNNLPLTADEEKIKINLNNALNKLPKYQGTVVRDLYFDDEEKLENFKKGYSVGDIKEFDEFISTTKAVSYNSDAQIRIIVNNCKNGRDLKGYNDDEQEVLYNLNSKFNVLNIFEKSNKTYIILEEEQK